MKSGRFKNFSSVKYYRTNESKIFSKRELNNLQFSLGHFLHRIVTSQANCEKAATNRHLENKCEKVGP